MDKGLYYIEGNKATPAIVKVNGASGGRGPRGATGPQGPTPEFIIIPSLVSTVIVIGDSQVGLSFGGFTTTGIGSVTTTGTGQLLII